MAAMRPLFLSLNEFKITDDISFEKIIRGTSLQKVTGIEWSKLAECLDEKHPFNTFNFANGNRFMNFIAKDLYNNGYWDQPIFFE